MRAQPAALFVQSESTEYFHVGGPAAQERADFFNEKRFLSLDLCYGRDVGARIFEYLTDNGLARDEANMVRLTQDGVPINGFTWYSLTDQVDWDTALRRTRAGEPARAVRPRPQTAGRSAPPIGGWCRKARHPCPRKACACTSSRPRCSRTLAWARLPPARLPARLRPPQLDLSDVMRRFMLLVALAVLAAVPAVVVRVLDLRPGPILDAAVFGLAILAAGFLLTGARRLPSNASLRASSLRPSPWSPCCRNTPSIFITRIRPGSKAPIRRTCITPPPT